MVRNKKNIKEILENQNNYDILNPNNERSEPYHYKTLKYHSDTISQLVFNPNNKELISASYDNSILIWDISNINTNKPKKLLGHKSLVNDMTISSTGLLIASASSDCTVRVWSNIPDESSSQIISQVYKNNSHPVKSVDISCDSKLLVTGSDDKTVKLIKISDKKLLTSFLAHSNWVKCVRFSKDSRLIVSASDDKSVKLWDVNKQIIHSTLPNVHNGVVNVVKFHPDNFSLATGCFDRKIRLFDVRSKKLVQVYDEHTKPVTNLDFHPNGNYLASASVDETVKIFDLRYGGVLYTLTGHEGATTAIAFSKFGEILATGGADSIVNLWMTDIDCGDKEDKYACNDFPINVDVDVNTVPQSVEYRSEKSSPKIFNEETGLNYRNKVEISELRDSRNGSFNYENVSEELSKVFERMVYQLELITTSFKNFEMRIAKIEECIDEINKEDIINDIEYSLRIGDEENLKNQLITNRVMNNNFSD